MQRAGSGRHGGPEPESGRASRACSIRIARESTDVGSTRRRHGWRGGQQLVLFKRWRNRRVSFIGFRVPKWGKRKSGACQRGAYGWPRELRCDGISAHYGCDGHVWFAGHRRR
jgi:hypothetical protein